MMEFEIYDRDVQFGVYVPSSMTELQTTEIPEIEWVGTPVRVIEQIDNSLARVSLLWRNNREVKLPIQSIVITDTLPPHSQTGALRPGVVQAINDTLAPIFLFGQNVNVDQRTFVRLLGSSISLSKREKSKIISQFPSLVPFQLESLERIFVEEHSKFDALVLNSPKYTSEIDSIVRTHLVEWVEVLHKITEENHV